MFLKLDVKRRLTIPAKLAATAPGDYFEARYDAAEDTIIFRRLKRKATWLDVLKECPVAMEPVPERGRKSSGKARK
jgi:bifunctional DNA-binding transcriptional regulator/antitoxin component of YhaV-PrlF toxin-antitoxin module